MTPRTLMLANLTLLLALAASPLLGCASPVGTASANCVVVLDDGGCTNPCLLVAGAVHRVDPSAPPEACPM
jgi:hypothetical protein